MGFERLELFAFFGGDFGERGFAPSWDFTKRCRVMRSELLLWENSIFFNCLDDIQNIRLNLTIKSNAARSVIILHDICFLLMHTIAA